METNKLFTLIWRGWCVGISVLFTPLFLLAVLFSTGVPKYLLLAIPLIAALQGAMLAAIVILGLKIWPLKN